MVSIIKATGLQPVDQQLESFITTKQACEFSALGYDALLASNCPRYKKGKYCLWKRSEIVAWIENSKQQ